MSCNTFENTSSRCWMADWETTYSGKKRILTSHYLPLHREHPDSHPWKLFESLRFRKTIGCPEICFDQKNKKKWSITLFINIKIFYWSPLLSMNFLIYLSMYSFDWLSLFFLLHWPLHSLHPMVLNVFKIVTLLWMFNAMLKNWLMNVSCFRYLKSLE